MWLGLSSTIPERALFHDPFGCLGLPFSLDLANPSANTIHQLLHYRVGISNPAFGHEENLCVRYGDDLQQRGRIAQPNLAHLSLIEREDPAIIATKGELLYAEGAIFVVISAPLLSYWASFLRMRHQHP